MHNPNHSAEGNRKQSSIKPPWWMIALIILFAFGGLVLFVYPTDKSEPQQLNNEPDKSNHSTEPSDSNGSSVTWSELAKDTELVASGKQVYDTHCIACHGPLGGGLTGPNLTDDFWIHDPYFENLFRIVMEGVDGKDMRALGPVIGAPAAKASLAYMASLRGSNPANAKAPEGTPQALP